MKKLRDIRQEGSPVEAPCPSKERALLHPEEGRRKAPRSNTTAPAILLSL